METRTEELLLEWLKTYRDGRVKPRTYERYEGLIRHHILPNIGKTAVESLSRRDVEEFLFGKRKENGRRGTLSAASVNLMLTVIDLAFEFGIETGAVTKNPCYRIRRLPDVTDKGDAFTKEEQKKLEAVIEASADGRSLGILICLYTGIRIGELLGLEWDDISFERGIMRIDKTVYRCKDENGDRYLRVDRPKTRYSVREIPLPFFLCEKLREQKSRSKSPYVIETKKGERMPIRSYQYHFRKTTEKAGVRSLNFHSLRHTFATRGIESGMDIRTLSEIMGHSSPSVTLNRYAHSMMDTKIEMMNRMTEYCRGGEKTKNCAE